ncbi:hypothetical protein IWQ61_003326 [Dispira simplex]|nr:hypothetical protein IWQ61_003326 [Dispira simplex]
MSQPVDNVPRFLLELTLDHRVVHSVVSAVVHAILFHRVFGNIVPRERVVLGVSCVSVDNPDISVEVDEKCSMFSSLLQNDAPQGKAELTLVFYKKPVKKGWFGKSEEANWEKWVIAVTLQNARTERELQQQRPGFRSQLSRTLFTIVKLASEYKDHIPPITNQAKNPFPFDIILPGNHESWSSMLKRML